MKVSSNKAACLVLPVAMALLALGGCKKKAEDQAKTAAGGELLPRSVGDDMLPYDTVKSQASLVDPNAGLAPPREAAPAALASDVPQADAVAEPAPVIDAAPPAPAPTQP
ncbi:hypothetical protein [Novosphingobium resinovorum]|uniref:hypothetical protein n=1 Tax=Novosphingobium resinovorum TaxID=158500 RepID=UPI002ED106AC|nr:hypothetical protein [Novosphingobium resinovorum]